MPANPAHSCRRNPDTGLTSIEEHVVALYDGGITKGVEMAEMIGCAPETVSCVLRRPHVLAAVQNRAVSEKLAPLIASREELQAYWTETLRDPDRPDKDRLKASELLGKSFALFTDKVEQKTTLTFEDQLRELARGSYDDL